MIGQEIGGYKIVEVLGRGGMGVVFKAVDTALDKVVAMKSLDPVHAESEQFLGRFRAEARTLGRLEHPHIVNVFAFRRVEPHLFIVMEYVDGGSLADLVQDRGALPWRETLPLIQQSLTAMAYAHDAGVIHRDIKPRNILLTGAGDVKVTDFGLAKIQEVSGDSHGLTRTGLTGGTLYYMPPEQLEGLNRVDHRGDLYALGMTCYELLAGRVPFDRSKAEFTILKAIDKHDFPTLGVLAPHVPKALAEVVEKALEHDPGDRYQSASEMLDAVTHIAANADTLIEEPDPAPPPDGATRIYQWKALPSDLDDPGDPPVSKEGSADESGASDETTGGDTSELMKSLKLQKGASGSWRVGEKEDDDEEGEEYIAPPAGAPSPSGSAASAGRAPEATVLVSEPNVRPARHAEREARAASARSSRSRTPDVVSERPAARRRLLPVLGALALAALVAAGLFLRPAGEDDPAGADPALAALSVESDPDGAAVFVDGEYVGTTPVRGFEAATGEHTLRVERSGYAPLDTVVALAAGQTPELSVRLAPRVSDEDGASTLEAVAEATAEADRDAPDEQVAAEGTADEDASAESESGIATIRSTPSGADVWRGNQLLGSTPLTVRNLAPGTHRFVLRKDGFEEQQAQVRAVAGETATASATLAPLVGTLRVLVRPFGEIYVNGDLTDRPSNAPYVAEREVGTYRVRAVHPVLGMWDKSVTVRGGEQREVIFDFGQTYRLTVVSEPSNAAILIDGEPTGRNTPSQITVRPGRRTIAVQKDGYAMTGSPQTLTVEGDRTDRPLRFQLRAR